MTMYIDNVPHPRLPFNHETKPERHRQMLLNTFVFLLHGDEAISLARHSQATID
jgi:hypothetical protein